jgi:hypothetical protein
VDIFRPVLPEVAGGSAGNLRGQAQLGLAHGRGIGRESRNSRWIEYQHGRNHPLMRQPPGGRP